MREKHKQYQQLLQKDANGAALRREKESPEKRKLRLQKEAKRAALSREKESPEKRLLRLQKEAKRIAAKRLHESEEQRQHRRKIEATRIAAKRKQKKKEEYQNLSQQVQCGDSIEHQERLVVYPFSSPGEAWKMKYFIKGKGKNEDKYFFLKRVCPCCRDLETEYEKELRKRLEEDLASELKKRQEYFQKHGEERPGYNRAKHLQDVLGRGLRQSGYIGWLTGYCKINI